jgi:hypothetical protein
MNLRDIFFNPSTIINGWDSDGYRVLTVAGKIALVMEAIRPDKPGSWVHARATLEQIAQLDEDNVPYSNFKHVAEGNKTSQGGPVHVFGNNPIRWDDTQDNIVIQKPTEAAPKKIKDLLNPPIEPEPRAKEPTAKGIKHE